MIRYRLICLNGHEFEAWFRNSEAYDAQRRRGQIACPNCASKKISKAVMAPSVAKPRRHQPPASSAPEPPVQVTNSGAAGADQMTPGQLAAAMRKLREAVLKNSEYVGPRFAEEARRIHEKEAEARGIYGEATAEEVGELVEDGIEVYPLPRLPEDQN